MIFIFWNSQESLKKDKNVKFPLLFTPTETKIHDILLDFLWAMENKTAVIETISGMI